MQGYGQFSVSMPEKKKKHAWLQSCHNMNIKWAQVLNSPWKAWILHVSVTHGMKSSKYQLNNIPTWDFSSVLGVHCKKKDISHGSSGSCCAAVVSCPFAHLPTPRPQQSPHRRPVSSEPPSRPSLPPGPQAQAPLPTPWRPESPAANTGDLWGLKSQQRKAAPSAIHGPWKGGGKTKA